MTHDTSILARLARACQDAVRDHGADFARVDAEVARWRASLDPVDRRRLEAAVAAANPRPDRARTVQ